MKVSIAPAQKVQQMFAQSLVFVHFSSPRKDGPPNRETAKNLAEKCLHPGAVQHYTLKQGALQAIGARPRERGTSWPLSEIFSKSKVRMCCRLVPRPAYSMPLCS